jgi:hypothetical protein
MLVGIIQRKKGGVLLNFSLCKNCVCVWPGADGQAAKNNVFITGLDFYFYKECACRSAPVRPDTHTIAGKFYIYEKLKYYRA